MATKKGKLGWMDVFKRVVAFIKAQGYDIRLDKGKDGKFKKFIDFENCDEDTPVELRFGGHFVRWNSVKDFMCATMDGHHAEIDVEGGGCVKLFYFLSLLECKYQRLVYRSLKELVEKLLPLAYVDLKAKTPIKVAKELDRVLA